jgi:Spy/CpxP family protein refolding chaperone
MKLKSLLGGIASALLLVMPAIAQAPPNTDERADFAWPVVALIFDHQKELALSSAQKENLERLLADFTREAIRRQADLTIAGLELVALLRPDPADPGKPIDMPKAEAKILEIGRIGTDLQIAGFRAVEASKALLTTEQRSKLAALLDDDRPGAQLAKAAQSYWYYCTSATAYHPTVPTCPEPWIKILPRAQ